MTCGQLYTLEIKRTDAWVKRDIQTMRDYQKQIDAHQKDCPQCNLFKQLFPSVIIGRDVVYEKPN